MPYHPVYANASSGCGRVFLEKRGFQCSLVAPVHLLRSDDMCSKLVLAAATGMSRLCASKTGLSVAEAAGCHFIATLFCLPAVPAMQGVITDALCTDTSILIQLRNTSCSAEMLAE